MVGCLRRLRRMFEVEGRGTKNAIVSQAKHTCISIDSNYIWEKGLEKQSSSGEDRVISAPHRGQGHGKQRMAERAISSEQGENVRQHSSSTMIKVRYIFVFCYLTFFGFRSARLLSRRRRLLGSRLALERKEGVAV